MTGTRVSLLDLKNLMDKQIKLSLNGKRTISGVLRGYDAFMNIVLDDTLEHIHRNELDETHPIGLVVIRGNSILTLEAQERF